MNEHKAEEELKEEPENLKYEIAISEESVKKKWLEKLKSNFSEQLQRFKEGPVEKHGWVLPGNALELFELYFSEFEKTIREKHRNNPTEMITMIDEETDEKYLVERDRADAELFPLVYDIITGGRIRLPVPIIPDEFLFKKIHKDNTLLGLVPYQESSNEKIRYESIPNITEEKKEPGAVRYYILNNLFKEKDELKALNEKQKEIILGYILGVSARTAKGFKNGEPKYFNNDHEKRAKELILKIKKGDIL